MRSIKSYVFIVLGVIIISALKSTVAIFPQDSQKSADKKQQLSRVDESQFPITDYIAPEPADPSERAKKHARGQKYNRRETAVNPELISISDRYQWDPSMPSLPVTQSDAVIIGEVTGAEAHLSSDKSGVYSEFNIRICEILKNDIQGSLQVPGLVVAEREGGRIRFPSGKITLMHVSNLGMPRVGGKYLLFLTHDFPFNIRRYEDYRILTGYELRDGKVFPLESSGVVNFDSQRGKDIQTVLAAIRSGK